MRTTREPTANGEAEQHTSQEQQKKSAPVSSIIREIEMSKKKAALRV